MSSSIAINLYKIDIDRLQEVLGERAVSTSDIPERLVERFNLGRSQEEGNSSYRPIAAANSATFAQQNNLIFYEKEQRTTVTHSWKNFFEKENIDLGEIRSATPNIVCFAVRNEDLFAITTGSASVVFEPFIDPIFPIELAKHILKPEVKGGKQQAISGVVQATDIYFRQPTRINIATSHQDVWQNLSGNVAKNILESEEFINIFGNRRSVSIEIKASVKITAKLEQPRQIISLLEWAQSTLEAELTAEQKAAFSFYDSIRPLTTRKDGYLINKLTDKLAELFFIESDCGLNLSHDEASQFINAETYILKLSGATIYDWDHTPDVEEVASMLFQLLEEGNSNREMLEKAQLHAAYVDQPYLDTHGNILRHLNGELAYEDKTYYLLNGKWFQVDESYLANTRSALVEILTSEQYTRLDFSDLSLSAYNHTKEGAYNKAQANSTRIYADQVFYNNLELADLIAFGESASVDIFHIKRGYAGSIRDVASQLRNAMNTIENDLSITGNPVLKAYYAALQRNDRMPEGVSEEGFINMFKSRKRRYMMAYVHKSKLTSDNIDNYSSSIAKNETVALTGAALQFSQSRTSFHIVWIKDESNGELE